MDDFILDFLASTNPQNPPNEIASALTKFRLKFNPNLCLNVSNSHLLKQLEFIFSRLLLCCESNSSLVRVSCFTALTSFLSKIIRSHPLEIQAAFSLFATKLVSPTKGSILIVFSFSYIATFISGQFFDHFFNSVPLYHHLSNCENSIEDFAQVFQNFPSQMSADNYITILICFVNQYQKTHNSKLLIPIQKIVEKCITLQKDSNAAIEEIYKSNNISLIAFIFTTINYNYDTFDLHRIALNALHKLKTAKFSERDDCFQILAIKSKSFTVNCSILDNILRLSIDDEYHDLNIDEYKDLPLFFSLFLPNSLLFPDRSKDSTSVISQKFRTIGRKLSDHNVILDVEEYIELFYKIIITEYDPIHQYLNNNTSNYQKVIEYNDEVSSAMRAFAVSLPCLILNAKSFKLILLLKQIMKMKIRSWIHGLDILNIIKSMKNYLFKYITLDERIELLLEFSMNKNDKLSSEGVNLIIEMAGVRETNEKNSYLKTYNLAFFDRITRIVARSIDFFSPQSLQKKLNILSEIIKNNENQNRVHLEYILSLLSTVYTDHLLDLQTLSVIFNFTQFFTSTNNVSIIQMNDNLIEISFAILIYSLLYIKGFDFTNKLSNDQTIYSSYIEQYINTRVIDIVSIHPFDFKLNFPLIANSYSFYLNQVKPDTSYKKKNIMFFIEQYFEYFPYESSKHLFLIEDIQHLSNTAVFEDVPMSTTNSIISNSSFLTSSSSIALSLCNFLFSKLKIVSNPNVFCFWVQAFPHNESSVSYAAYFLKHSSETNGSKLTAKQFNIFSLFLNNFGKKYNEIISHCIMNIDPDITSDYILLALLNKEFMLKFNKEINMKSAVFREDFDKMEPGYKMEYTKRFVIYNERNLNEKPLKIAFSPALIEFGLKNLKGWEKMAFLLKCQNSIKNVHNEFFDKELRLFEDFPKNDRAFNRFFTLRPNDTIHDQLIYYIYTDNKKRIKFTLRMSAIKDMAFDFNDLELKKAIQSSSESLKQISKFLQKRNSSLKNHARIQEKINLLHHESGSITPHINLEIPFEPTDFIQYLLKKDRLRKREVIEACSLINSTNLTTQVSFEFYSKFSKNHSKLMLSFLTSFLIQLRIRRIKYSIDHEFVDFFFNTIAELTNYENIREASTAALYLVVLASDNLNSMQFQENHLNAIKSLFGFCGINSPELSALFSAMVTILYSNQQSNEQDNSIQTDNLCNVLSRLIESEYPSQILAGVRLMRRIVLTMKGQSIQLIEPNLEKMILRSIEICSLPHSQNATLMNLLRRCGKSPLIASSVSNLLRIILQIHSLKKLYRIIVRNANQLCQLSFEFLTNLASPLINNYSIDSAIVSFLNDLVNSLFEFQKIPKQKSCRQKLYFSLTDISFIINYLSSRLKKIDTDKRESILLNFVYSFIQNFDWYDHINLSMLYMKWCDYILDNLASDSCKHSYQILFKIISEQFMTRSTRFFPVFIVFVKKIIDFLSVKSDSIKTDERVNIILSAIDNAFALMINDTHKYALTRLKFAHDLREVLEIAQLETEL